MRGAQFLQTDHDPLARTGAIRFGPDVVDDQNLLALVAVLGAEAGIHHSDAFAGNPAPTSR